MLYLFILLVCLTQSIACQDSTPDNTQPVAVTAVRAETSGDDYTLVVTIQSDETGCDQYANWWEVTDESGTKLIYRRILGHSHVDEQPFARSGGPITIEPDQQVVIRAHMHPHGYGETALQGSVVDGFKTITLDAGFGEDLEMVEPQPGSCAF